MADGVDLFSQLPPELVQNVNTILTLFQILGGIILIYIIISLINLFLNKKKVNEMKKINISLDEIKKLLKKS